MNPDYSLPNWTTNRGTLTESSTFDSAWMGIWDLQNRHATIMFTADGPGRDMVVDEEAPKPYDNISKYSTRVA